MKRYTFKITYGFRDDLGFPFKDEMEHTVTARTLDEAYMELDYYCEINDITAIDYKLISSVKLERAAVLIGTM